MPDQADEAPKIQIDSDWKAQAQAEKERLRAQEKAAKSADSATGGATGTSTGPDAAAAGGHPEFPPANWETLMGSLVSQAMMYLGAFADPRSGQPMIELDAARHYVDLLGVLEEKTKGNLDEEETKNLATVIYELRMRYVQISQAVTGGSTASTLAGAAGGGGMGGVGAAGEIGGTGSFGMGTESGASNLGEIG